MGGCNNAHEFQAFEAPAKTPFNGLWIWKSRVQVPSVTLVHKTFLPKHFSLPHGGRGLEYPSSTSAFSHASAPINRLWRRRGIPESGRFKFGSMGTLAVPPEYGRFF